MTQYIIISIILGIAVFYIGLKIYNLFVENNSPCNGCSGCAMKEQMRKQHDKHGRKLACNNKL